jgi:hypothetical protein
MALFSRGIDFSSAAMLDLRGCGNQEESGGTLGLTTHIYGTHLSVHWKGGAGSPGRLNGSYG